jgi:class 3 adenylate cyclase/DNA-binding transcriptional MerR regulator
VVTKETKESFMISSKEVLEITGISRATLNNYIALGLVSKPTVQTSRGTGIGPRMLGYFPDDVCQRIEQIKEFKRAGLGNQEILDRLDSLGITAMTQNAQVKTQAQSLVANLSSQTKTASAAKLAKPEKNQVYSANHANVVMEAHQTMSHGAPLSLTLEELKHPAYMMSHNFELTWFNDAAREQFLGNFDELEANREQRHVLQMLYRVGQQSLGAERFGLLKLHLGMAKSKFSKEVVLSTLSTKDVHELRLMGELYDASELLDYQGLVNEKYFEIAQTLTGDVKSYKMVSTCFREGILVVCVPAEEETQTIAEFLSRRDMVIRHLLKKKIPVLTQLAVLVTDLQASTRICSELPADEYFQLINEIWASMDPIFRRYYGTHGKHVGDGMVYYFFPQPDSSYIFNALACAMEVKKEIRRISERWRIKKDWLNDLFLNTAVHEGQEWLGTFQTSTSIEFAVLGNTINQAARVSDFARHGSIWATKDLMSKLSTEERDQIDFGVSRQLEDRQHFVPSSYAQIESLVDLKSGRYEKLKDISTLAITEIRSIQTTR